MKILGPILLVIFACVECSVYTGYLPQYPNYPAWNYQSQNPPKPIPQQGPIVPGSPQWKRLQFIKKYQASQRSRTSDVVYGPNSEAITKFEEEALLYHNSHRRLHAVDDLVLDHALSKKASKFAFSLANDMRIAHSSPTKRIGQGENVAAGCKVSGPGLTVFEAVKYWYQTVCNANWVSSKHGEKSRPFTNMVWKSTKQFGIGFANFQTKNGFNCSVIVARYSPQGSTPQPGDYSKNVKKGLFVPANCHYVMDRDKPEFIQPAIEQSSPSKDFHGQMIKECSSCTFSQLFSTFGASKRNGKLSFRVVL